MVDANEPGVDAQALRGIALERLAARVLTPAMLVKLAERRTALLYDLVELPYAGADVDQVDRLRQVAMAAVELILNERGNGGTGD